MGSWPNRSISDSIIRKKSICRECHLSFNCVQVKETQTYGKFLHNMHILPALNETILPSQTNIENKAQTWFCVLERNKNMWDEKSDQ